MPPYNDSSDRSTMIFEHTFLHEHVCVYVQVVMLMVDAVLVGAFGPPKFQLEQETDWPVSTLLQVEIQNGQGGHGEKGTRHMKHDVSCKE